MSKPKPPTPNRASSHRRRAPAPWWRRDGVWFIGSIALHVLAVLVIWLTPVRGMIFNRPTAQEFEVTARAERIDEMIEYLRQREGDVIEEYMAELFNIEDELSDILDTKEDQFDTLAAKLALDAPERALAAQEQALKAQAEALTAEGEVLANVGDRAKAAHQRARDAQGRAGDAQRLSVESLAFVGPHFDAAKAAQDRANEAQKAASREQGKVSELQEHAPGVYKAVQHAADQADQAAKAVAEVARDVDRAESTAAAARTAADKAREKANEAKRQAVRSKSDSDRTRAADAKRQADQAHRAAQQADGVKRSAESKVNVAKNRLKGAQRKAADTARRAEAAGKRHQTTHARVAGTQGAAQKLQAKAHKAQAEARDILRKAIDSASPADRSAVAKGSADDASDANSRPSLRGKSIAELYDQAIEAERDVSKTFQKIHATAVATLRGIPVADAMRETEAIKTDRPELNRKLLSSKVRTAKAAAAHRAEIGKATGEVAAMVDAAQRLLNRAREDQAGGTSMSVESMMAAAAKNRQLDQLAAEDESKRHKDLSGAMKGARAGSKAAGAKKTGGGSGSGRKYSRGPYSLAGRNPKDVVPGRVVVVRGANPSVFVRDAKTKTSKWIQAKWMYVDSWYTIGPFPNPGRKNIDTHFPPQSVIDLDAVYEGKNKRKVKWQFVKTPDARVFPADDEAYGIYYAYTELWFEEAMDLVIAVGSDDNSRLWIEGKQVWLSGRQLKSWRADEGYRTVHFKKGINRILYRVENGWRETLFSMLICLQGRR